MERFLFYFVACSAVLFSGLQNVSAEDSQTPYPYQYSSMLETPHPAMAFYYQDGENTQMPSEMVGAPRGGRNVANYGMTRREIKSMPITDRPSRPGHFYGNTVRRRAGV